MAGRKSDFTLPKFDDIFSTQEMRDEEKLSKIRDIPLEQIDDFPDHPYRVQDDEDMIQVYRQSTAINLSRFQLASIPMQTGVLFWWQKRLRHKPFLLSKKEVYNGRYKDKRYS